MEKPINITLNADGTVTGDISATWKITKSGTPYMSFTWGGVTYKGAFIVQNDESAQEVKKMTFTATGINICIWGSKKTAYVPSEDIVNKTPISNGTYTIKNLNSGLYLNADTAKNSGSAEQNNTEQVWNVTADSEGWYTLRTVDGKAMTVANSSSENGADIIIADYNGSNSQKFRILDDGNGNMAVLSAVSDCKAGLDVYNISPDAGANICQWEYWGGNGQKFIFDTAENIISEPAYPQVYLVEYNENYHQIRFNWKPVSGAQNYGIAVYLAGKWRIQTQSIAGSATSYTTPKNLTAGKTYTVAIAAKVNGVWGAAEAIKHAVTVTVK